ncbi:MAG: hypothetical protein KJN64_02430 [Ignavibacteria bacterium]|nr:hypothetical protein [Ignavibacteria bacterium]MBT8381514.1 hypothetical protein [Ignavibacteria bacterium]MBT8393084.1 hypothetical protein [Ignavibacteria bacterium]NNJ51646.1 hypothetical protein [Ignavibacteriaceae bacterium]NNL22771.1 hypothetical protein [Ignavibacteriaceae bacterium]
MTTIDVKKLTSTTSDWETNEYVILSKVRDWLDQINRNKIFPALAESHNLNQSLEDIVRENLDCKLWFDNEIRARRINERLTVYEKAHQIGFKLDRMFDFIKWALKINKQVITESEIIKEFIEENLQLRKISATDKNFNGKGYFALPDNKKELLNVYLYEVVWDWSQEHIKQRLQSKLVRSIPQQLVKNPVEQLMMEFINFSQELYDPVVYIFETDIDFPYKESMLPIAEERLLNVLCA